MSENAKKIHQLIEIGDIEAVGDLLATEPDVMLEQDSLGNYPLHTACWVKQPQLIALLISHGADVNQAGGRGDTPLHLAVTEGDAISLPIISELMSNGADPLIRNHVGHNAIDWAKIQADGSLAEMLRLMKNE